MIKAFFLLSAIIIILPFTLIAQTPEGNPIDSIADSARDSLGITVGDSEIIDSNFIYPMPPERKQLLISYSKFNNIWRFISFFIEIALLGFIVFTGFSSQLRTLAEKISGKRIIHWFFYIVFFTVIWYIINLPIDYYRQFIVEHEYGFSNQTSGEWFVEGLKSLGLGVFFSFLILSILYWLINRFKKWWLYFAIGTIPFAIVAIIIIPVAVAPMFNKFEPLKDKQLAGKMLDLAEKAGISNPDVFQVDASKQSKKINAYFTGMLGTRRIVLYDNLINNFSHEEIEFVMGHEIGHYKMHHIWKGLFIAVIIIFFAALLADKALPRIIDKYRHKIGFDRLGDIASVPLLLLFISLFSFITQPVGNGISRIHEYDSDKYGLEITGVSTEDAIRAFDKLSVFNLSDPDPSAIVEFWFYDHPSLKKRMANIKVLYDELNR